MRRGCRTWLVMATLTIVILTSGCGRLWKDRGNELETITLPETSTVTGARVAQRQEPGRLSEYASYASVRIATTASVRVYVDEREERSIVVATQALNDKGEDVLAGTNLVGMEYTDAVRRLVERMLEKGYASDLNAKAKVEAQPGSLTNNAEALEKDAVTILSKVFKEHGIEAVFGTEERR